MNDEKLLRDYLAADAGVSALVGARVSTRHPAEPTYPLVVLRRFAAEDQAWGHIFMPRIQIEAWAETGPEAAQLEQAVREAMKAQTIAGTHAEGVVTHAEFVLARNFTDPATSRPRYILDYRVWMHPAAA